MHFSLATIFAVVTLLASNAHTTHVTIPLSKRTNIYRSDGSVDLAALKRQTDYSTTKILRGLLNYERNTGQRHPLSLRVGDFKRAVASNPLHDVQSIVWIGNVSVGTPPVEFTVDFDTGSCDFYLPDPRCKSCGDHTRYNAPDSSTSISLGRTFGFEYGYGYTVSGSLYNDTVTIAGLTALQQTLGAATKYTDNFESASDGVMGMAFRSISTYNADPIFLGLVDQGQTTLPIFAMKMTNGGSELTLGGLNSALYTGNITFVPVVQVGYWQVNFDSLDVGEEVVIGRTPCIIDSGTMLIIGTPPDVAAFYAMIPGSQPDADGYYTFTCGSNLPDILFYFNGRAFSIAQSFNLGPDSPGSDRCVGSITSDADAPSWILGANFMTNYYTVFDLGNVQVGFATLA